MVEAGKPVVLSVHRENDASSSARRAPPSDPGPKAGFRVLNVASGSLTSADRYEPGRRG